MLTLYMTKGLPASGKDTWFEEECKSRLIDNRESLKRVNKDMLRNMIDCGKHSKEREKIILKSRDALVKLFLGEGSSVAVTDTNLHSKHETQLRLIADDFNAEFKVVDFTDVPLWICIERDAKREPEKVVGHKVIYRMWEQFIKKEQKALEHYAPKVVICDLDGTIALRTSDRSPFDGTRVMEDGVNTPVYRVITSLLSTAVIDEVIFVSGRSDKCRELTRQWIEEKLVEIPLEKYNLLMRKDGDSRNDGIVKNEIYHEYIKGKYNVLFSLDDRCSTVDVWRKNGIPTFQVNYGMF